MLNTRTKMVAKIKHEFDDGTIISETVIDIELSRAGGKVSRGEVLDLARVANNIRKERDISRAQSKLSVGNGSGDLFVQGDCEAIKVCQQKLLELEEYHKLFFLLSKNVETSDA